MGSLRQLCSSVFYLVGTSLLTPACILLLPEGNFEAAIAMLITACSFLTVAASIDIRYVVFADGIGLLEKFSALYMLIGGVLFLTASILYWPSFGTVLSMSAANLGTWVFRIGSISYMCGSFTSLYLLLQSEDSDASEPLIPLKQASTPELSYLLSSRSMWLTVIFCFIIGAILYIAGGVLTQMDKPIVSAITWIIGSFLFFTGAFVQLLEVVRSFDQPHSRSTVSKSHALDIEY